ncbi:YccS family putative transporter [Gynuella sunshinyii]|uniref:Putative membrane protein n=1 Tax=Gynuella sunshinyii YC6258 TaxID=1445510 RepID=A0A0C5VHB7_9GAMM|nr:YccS family putative transporter [Gynuella sunshinyii]AJQ93641.1 putative membrane protein [Gynuella sunshinyii YC6258]
MQWLQTLRLYWANKTINYSFLILVTLLGVVIPAWYWQRIDLIIPLILGIIAAALAESDDSFSGRIKALVLTLCCFALAAFSVELLFDYPILFAIGLFSSTFGFIILGSLGPKYSSIAFGSLLLAIYTMIGAHQSTNLWFQPVMLLSGAAWYYLVSMTWQAIWPMQPVQQSLASVFLDLADYIDVKAELFHPVDNLIPQPLRIKEARLNVSTVQSLNNCKATFLSRSRRGRIGGPSDRFLNIYFIAQDIHERVSSTHYRYQDLARAFERSDILFRFQYLLQTHAQCYRDIAHAIKMGRPYEHSSKAVQALEELISAMSYLKGQQNPGPKNLITQLTYLFDNVAMISSQIENLNNPDARQTDEGALNDTDPHTIRTMWRRISSHLNKDSRIFRHAIRLSIALTVGYGIIQALGLERGYWIMLTTLFVCQPNYSATRKKLVNRVIGTIAGLLIGAFLLTVFPSHESQLVFIVISGVLFFAFRLNNYGYATGFITLLVLFCFNQLGEGYAVVLPRLADTLVGCALAVVAVTRILPDWHARRLHKVLADAVQANQDYLAQIIEQYLIGKKDNLNYRIARRYAHNQDANLSVSISNMLSEPDKYRISVEESFRFLTLSHAILGYISALGAHRTKLIQAPTHQLVIDSHNLIHRHLETLHKQLNNKDHSMDLSTIGQSELEQRLNEWRDEDESSARLVLQQLQLIYRLLPELHTLAEKIAGKGNNI